MDHIIHKIRIIFIFDYHNFGNWIEFFIAFSSPVPFPCFSSLYQLAFILCKLCFYDHFAANPLFCAYKIIMFAATIDFIASSLAHSITTTLSHPTTGGGWNKRAFWGWQALKTNSFAADSPTEKDFKNLFLLNVFLSFTSASFISVSLISNEVLSLSLSRF